MVKKSSTHMVAHIHLELCRCRVFNTLVWPLWVLHACGAEINKHAESS